MISGMHLSRLGDGAVLLEPGGALDPSRPDNYLEPLIGFLQQRNERRLIYDLNEVAVIDPVYFHWLSRLADACRIVGVDMVVANMRPAAAYALAVELDRDPPFICALDVDRARGR